MSGSPTSSSRPTPEVGVAAVYRGRELRVVCVVQALLVLVVVGGWAVVAGTQAAALDDAGIFSGIATAVAAVVGVVLVTLRGSGRPDAGARFMRMGFVLPALVAFALIQLPLAFLVAVLGYELMWVVVGSMIGLVVAGLGGSLLTLFVAGGILGWTEAPPGTGFAGRSSWAVFIVATLVMAVGLGIGSRAEVRGNRDIGGLVVALLGSEGDVRSEAWLWVARAAVVVHGGRGCRGRPDRPQRAPPRGFSRSRGGRRRRAAGTGSPG